MQVTRLSSFYDFQYGKGNNNPDNGGRYPVYGSNGIIGWYDKYNSEDAPVIGHIGANCGSVVWAKGKHFVTYNGVICKIKAGCNPRYGYYLLLNSNLKSRFRGAAQPFISYDLLENVIVYNPPKAVQDKIASILSAYDNLIENNNKRIRLLEQMAENLYKEWFVRFRFPGHEKVEMENGLPKGWKVASFGDLFPIKTGKKDANYSSEDGKYKFFTCSQEPLKANDYSFDCFAIILAGNGDLNAKLYRGKFEAYQRTYVLSPNDLDNIYVSYYTIRDELVHLLAGAAGAVIKFLTKGMIEKVKVTIAPSSIMNEFNTIQEKMFNLRESLIIENEKLTRQRDLLLPRLMSGKLEVKE